MKILFVSEVRPYPLHGGKYIHVYNTLESLSQHFQVVAVCPTVVESCPLRERITEWYTLPDYESGWRVKVRNAWSELAPRPAWQAYLTEILAEQRPDVVWFIYGHWGQYVPLVYRYGAAAVMHTQNVQSKITQQMAATMPFGWPRLMLWLRACLQILHERTLFSRFDYVVSITEEDRQYHARFVENQRSLLLPGYLSEAAYQASDSVQRQDNLLILTGSFDAFQNRKAVQWFMGQVWPTVQAACPSVELLIAGADARSLPASILEEKQVSVVDSVADMTPYLRRATISVVPIFHGSGMRFKILEALASELPIVSTALGAQGIDVVHGESILLADSAADFAEAIISLLRDEQKRQHLSKSGLDMFRKSYSAQVNTIKICALINSLHGRNNEFTATLTSDP